MRYFFRADDVRHRPARRTHQRSPQAVESP